VDIGAVRRDARVVAEDSQEILGEGGGDRTERRCTDDDELRPAEEKGGETPPRFADVDVNSTSARKYSGDFGESQRAAKREESAGDPDREQRKRSGSLFAMPAGDRKIPEPIVEPTRTATALQRPRRRGSDELRANASLSSRIAKKSRRN
jgi:hypothetical protein